MQKNVFGGANGNFKNLNIFTIVVKVRVRILIIIKVKVTVRQELGLGLGLDFEIFLFQNLSHLQNGTFQPVRVRLGLVINIKVGSGNPV